MISFERTMRFLTGVQFQGGMFFAMLFFPAFGFLIAGEFRYATIATVSTVGFIFFMGALVDIIQDTPYVAVVMTGANLGALTYGLISSFTGGGIIIFAQWLIYFMVTRDSITDLHNDIRTVMQHRDDLYEECKRIEESNKKT